MADNAFLLSDQAGSEFRLNQKIIFQDPLVQGDLWTFGMYAANYVSSGYSAVITVAAGIINFSVPATPIYPNFTWSIPGSTTSQLTPQPYLYNVHFIDPTGNRTTVERGGFIVAQDITIANQSVDACTNLEKMLKAVDCTLLDILNSKVQIAQFGGQSYTLHNVRELFTVRNEIYDRVVEERIRLSGNMRSSNIVTVFRNM